ncbi:MAG: DUF1553 domain-containing protein [Acidobacteria bacterium]|nr:DUF1553 domain-containing protein [Acidobacteriota bacterium]
MRLLVAFLAVPSLFAAPSFEADVLPLFEQRCQVCHNDSNPQAGLALTSRASLLKGGKGGPAIVPGDASASLLLAKTAGDKPAMPPVGEPLTAEQRALLAAWIDAGAQGGEAAGGEQTWWSLRPIERPAPPSAGGNPIDAFIQATLAEKGLAASPEADRRTLIRRLYYDLHGLQPTPEEVRSFVADESPEAYEQLVDRLLASPRYGERQARWWLDVAHYGETHGYDKDKPRRNAWPYRDWVIRAFNDDKPYRDFVREQIAGDALRPDDPDALIATGFLAAGPWDFVGHAELREGTRDKRIARLLDRDDMVMTVMSTFSSMTVHCARCHNHKFDPILQSDYYAVQAVFAGVDRADRPFDRDPATFRLRREVRARLAQNELALRPLQEALAAQTNEGVEALAAEAEEIRKARTLLFHAKTAGETPEQKAENQRLDGEIERMAAEAKKLDEERNSLMRGLLPAADRAELERLEQERKELIARQKTLPEPESVYAAASYFDSFGKFEPAIEPRTVSVLARGDVDSPLEPAVPGALTAVKVLPARFEVPDGAPEGERRLALANWLVDERNPLTWRSIANRIWQTHFGRGLVGSPSDFGRMGEKPTHPELLDWLAAGLRDSGGSLKSLHRRILLSQTYRQQSASRQDFAKIDAGNQFLWRQNRRRLDAESVRDSVLQAAGRLDLTMYGPSDEHFFFINDHSPVYDYARFDIDAQPTQRRSIYRFLVRSVPDPFMESLDCPDPSILTPQRNVTLTAVQALAMLNDPLLIEESRNLAKRLRAEGEGLDAQVRRAVELTLSREPQPAEAKTLERFADEQGLENLARLLFNSNEFLFVD